VLKQQVAALLLKQQDRPNIIKIYDYTVFCQGGKLFERSDDRLDEIQVAMAIKQVLLAVNTST